MSKIEDGGPAFPTSIEWGLEGGVGFDGDEAGKPNSTTYYRGMTLRDYFAAKALAALIIDSYSPDEGYRPDVTAERAYWFADAMLKAREGK